MYHRPGSARLGLSTSLGSAGKSAHSTWFRPALEEKHGTAYRSACRLLQPGPVGCWHILSLILGDRVWVECKSLPSRVDASSHHVIFGIEANVFWQPWRGTCFPTWLHYLRMTCQYRVNTRQSNSTQMDYAWTDLRHGNLNRQSKHGFPLDSFRFCGVVQVEVWSGDAHGHP